MRQMIVLLMVLFQFKGITQDKMSVHFEFDKARLTVNGRASLDSLVKQVSIAAPKIEFQITGHTDAIGPDYYNQRLSERRINAVRSYLLKQGIPNSNIKEVKAFGESLPLVNNNSPEQRAINRRVEIIVMKEGTGNTEPVSLKEKLADSTLIAGTNITLRNINFYGGMHQFLPESEPALKELLDAMRTYPKLVIRIEGHICCQDGPQDGMDIETNIRNLSEARAKAVMDYLIAAGISSSRLSYKGYAHTNPIYPYPERTEEEQTLNRRVEIKIISK